MIGIIPSPAKLDGFDASPNVWIACTHDSFDYHIWIKRDTLQPTDDTVYKKSAAANADIRRVRKLSRHRGQGKLIADYLLKQAPLLWPDFVKRTEARHDAEAIEVTKRRLANQAHEAGPELLVALQMLLDTCNCDCGTTDCEVVARQLIKRVTT